MEVSREVIHVSKQRLRSANKDFIKQWFVRGDIIKQGRTREEVSKLVSKGYVQQAGVEDKMWDEDQQAGAEWRLGSTGQGVCSHQAIEGRQGLSVGDTARDQLTGEKGGRAGQQGRHVKSAGGGGGAVVRGALLGDYV